MADIQNQDDIFKELQKTKELLEARTYLAQMGMVSSIWRHTVSGEALAIRACVNILQQLISTNASNEKIEKILGRIDNAASSILTTPTTFPLTSKDGVETIYAYNFIEGYVQRLQENDVLEGVKLQTEFHINKNIAIKISSTWLRLCLDLIMENAIEAMTLASKKILSIKVTSQEDTLNISLSDSGHGISPEILSKLFKEPISSKENKLGRGLLMGNLILETYEGNLEVENTSPNGSTISLSLQITKHAK